MRKRITNNLEKLVKEIKELKKLMSSSDYVSGEIYIDMIFINIENILETTYISLETLLKEFKKLERIEKIERFLLKER